MLTPRNIQTSRISESLPKFPDYDLAVARRRAMDKDSEEHTDRNGIASNLLEFATASSEDYDHYESLPETTTMTTHLMAGAVAGIMEHCVMYPVDSVKVSDPARLGWLWGRQDDDMWGLSLES